MYNLALAISVLLQTGSFPCDLIGALAHQLPVK